MKTLSILGTVLLAMLPAAAAAKPYVSPDPGPGIATPGTVSQFDVSDKTEVPGHTLKPGSYSITVVDHLADRMVLRVGGQRRQGNRQSSWRFRRPTPFPGKAAPVRWT